MMKIGITNDHAGLKMKKRICKYLLKKGYEVINYGTDTKESVDYPDMAKKLTDAILSGDVEYGIAICNTGIGISIACNRVKGIRCAKAHDIREAKLTRIDNNANVLAFSAHMPFYKVKDIIDVFLTTDFSNMERHKRRIEKLDKLSK